MVEFQRINYKGGGFSPLLIYLSFYLNGYDLIKLTSYIYFLTWTKRQNVKKIEKWMKTKSERILYFLLVLLLWLDLANGRKDVDNL